MRWILFITLIFFGCKTLSISHDLNDREACRLLKQAEEETEKYSVNFNADSTYALCILNDNSQLVSEPITFIIVGVDRKEKVLVSINEYHRARWLDNENLLFTSYSEAPNSGRNINKMPGSGIRKYIFNVISKQIRLCESETENN